jgi:hypothetical protein
MADLDVDALFGRFRDRAGAVRERSLPPVAGEERRRLIEAAEIDFMDFSLIAAASWAVEDGALVLRIPLSR